MNLFSWRNMCISPKLPKLWDENCFKYVKNKLRAKRFRDPAIPELVKHAVEVTHAAPSGTEAPPAARLVNKFPEVIAVSRRGV